MSESLFQVARSHDHAPELVAEAACHAERKHNSQALVRAASLRQTQEGLHSQHRACIPSLSTKSMCFVQHSTFIFIQILCS